VVRVWSFAVSGYILNIKYSNNIKLSGVFINLLRELILLRLRVSDSGFNYYYYILKSLRWSAEILAAIILLYK